MVVYPDIVKLVVLLPVDVHKASTLTLMMIRAPGANTGVVNPPAEVILLLIFALPEL